MRRVLPLVALAGVALMAASGALAGDGRLSPELQAVRADVARFHSVDQALAAGYVPGSPCEESPAGAMGFHYVKPALFGPGLDSSNPEVLLYIPGADGSLKLAGVEYFQADADQDLATDVDRPSLFGQPFDGPMLGHGPGMPIHYDLHVWVAEANPAGVFAQWNPAISCP
ncbi:MAG: hypothetical protein EPO36_01360 [Chloroflexota bacterium]|nr:MAG: hypothetical protein EPO36_01360 [Chloroflexota bacterium]